MRWEGDDRGTGVADASAFADAVEDLLRATRKESWVAEEPEAHLLPHLVRACDALPLAIVGTAVAGDGSFDIELEWTGAKDSIGEVRAAVFALVGSIAEMSTSVRQNPDRSSGVLSFDVVTGFVGNEGRFAAHGHALRLAVRGV